MKILKTLAVFALASCAALVRADPPSQVGRLNFISGPVSFAPAEASNDWALATLNRPITTGDRLWADRDAGAEMHVGSTVIRMTGLTSVDVLNIDDRNIQLGLADGGVNVRLRNSPSDKLFEVDTPHGAVILNQPGSYRVSVDPSGAETTVTVRSGQAEVFTGASSFPVDANERARITGTDFLSYDIAAAPPMDEFDRWAAARDRKEDRIASTRYVSPEMTGYEDLDEYGSWRVVGDYGSVWVPAAVPVGWAPYRYGHWVWISPWGWTWVDSAPWGFAPFHYGRWVWVGRYWAWAPGPVAVRPVYAPALVAFVGGSNWSVSAGIGSAPVVGWVPLGWREPFIPWYRVSPTYVRNVNVAHVTNVNVTNIYNNTTVTNVRHANRNAPSGVTVVRREHFVSAKPVEPVKISSQALATAPVTSAAPVHTPQSASFATSRPGPRPPARVLAREVVAVNAPPVPMRDDGANVPKGDRGPAFARSSGERPRVRVINRQQRVELQAAETQRGSAPAAQAQSAAEAQRLQEQQAGRNRAERANEKGAQQAQPGTQAVEAKAGERVQEKAAPQARPGQQAERRAPAPPPELSRRPTFDREMRQTVPQPGTPSAAEARREQRQAERQERREQASGQGRNAPQTQSAPQPETRATPRPAPEQRTEQQDRQRQQQAQEQQAREQQARQREMQQREEERQKAQQQRAQQQAQEQQAREQQARQREMQQREEERQKAQQQRAQQQAQEQQAREQRAQLQRAQQQAQEQQAREHQGRQREMQQQVEREKAQQQQQQQREQRLRENAEKHAPQASLAAERRPQPQRAEQARGKGPDRQRAEKSD